MKILITGMNKTQHQENFFLNQQLQIVSSLYSLVHCLRDMGHKVEQRQTFLDEKLDEYDRIIVYLSSPRMFNSKNVFNCLVAMSRRKDCIIAFDDWRSKNYDNLKNILDKKESIFTNFIFSNNEIEKKDIEGYEDEVIDGLSLIFEQKNRLLFPTFSGGNLENLIDRYPKELMYRYNPNPYNLNRKPDNNYGEIRNSLFDNNEIDKKEMCFNFASLMQSDTVSWLKKQKISKWPIHFYGKKDQIRLKENEMCQVFAKEWCSLLPGYNISEVGWWRAKPQQVADVNSILIGDKKEMMIYYQDEYLSNLTPNDIENMNEKELKEVAQKQKKCFYKTHPLDKNVQQKELKEALNI